MAQPEGQHGKHSTLLPEPPIATEGPTQRTGGIPNATAMPPARTGLACSLVPVRGPEERAAGPQAEDGVTGGDPKDQGGSSHTAQHVPHSDPNALCPGGLAARCTWVQGHRQYAALRAEGISPRLSGAGSSGACPGGSERADSLPALFHFHSRTVPGRKPPPQTPPSPPAARPHPPPRGAVAAPAPAELSAAAPGEQGGGGSAGGVPAPGPPRWARSPPPHLPSRRRSGGEAGQGKQAPGWGWGWGRAAPPGDLRSLPAPSEGGAPVGSGLRPPPPPSNPLPKEPPRPGAPRNRRPPTVPGAPRIAVHREGRGGKGGTGGYGDTRGGTRRAGGR